jgi:hypothetical protein
MSDRDWSRQSLSGAQTIEETSWVLGLWRRYLEVSKGHNSIGSNIEKDTPAPVRAARAGLAKVTRR